MEHFKKILKSPTLALGLTPLIFALSQIIILGYNWISRGHAGDLTITVSRYVGLELWTSILFAAFNIAIIVIMFRYYLSLKKSRSTLWFIFGCLQVVGFFFLSVFPHNIFLQGDIKEFFVNVHEYSARLMFASMFGMAIETLRLSYPNHLKPLQNLSLLKSPKKLLFPKVTTPVCIFFIIYGLFYVTIYITRWDVIWSRVLILETGYIYAFMAFLILTRTVKPSDA